MEKVPDAEKYRRQKEKQTTEDEMVGWHHHLHGQIEQFWELVMEMEAWHAAVHLVTKSQTRLSD